MSDEKFRETTEQLRERIKQGREMRRKQDIKHGCELCRAHAPLSIMKSNDLIHWACPQCGNEKIRQWNPREVYSLQAFFNRTKTRIAIAKSNVLEEIKTFFWYMFVYDARNTGR